MIKWKCNNDDSLEDHMDILVRISKIKNEEDTTTEYIKRSIEILFQKFEDVEIHDFSFGFSPIAMALVRRTFPTLFANKIVGVQPMNPPVGLSYAMRIIYEKDEEKNV